MPTRAPLSLVTLNSTPAMPRPVTESIFLMSSPGSGVLVNSTSATSPGTRRTVFSAVSIS